MIESTPVLCMSSLNKIVYNLNLIHIMVHELNYHYNENVYNKPKNRNGL
jgi:hypothetical protein